MIPVRDARRFGISAATVFALVWVVLWFVPRTYEAGVELHRSEVTAAPSSQIAQELRSRAALEAVADDSALPFADRFVRTEEGELTAAGRRQRAAWLKTLADRIDVRASPESVLLSVQDRDPRLAAAMADRLADHVLASAQQRTAARLASAEDHLAEQIALCRDELTVLRLEQARIERERPHLRDAAAAHGELLAAQTELRSMEQQAVQLDDEYAALSAWLAGEPDYLEQRTRGRNPAVAHLNAQKAQLEQQLTEHRYQWGRTDDHPLVRRTLDQIAAVEAKLETTPAIIDLAAQRQDNVAKRQAQATLESLSARRRSLAARAEALRRQIEQLEAQQQADALGRDAYMNVQRQIAAAQQELDAWEQKRRDTALAAASAAPGWTRMGEAAPPLQPTFPPRGAGTLIALLAGALAGLTVAAWGCMGRRGYDSAETAQTDLEMPVLGVVSRMDDRRPAMSWRRAA